eukprot:CAMPEP_0181206292 /NCGR_PEP_ID=MMETSP1096-20121128/20954_1 /TAXON_ID=156174 ORGANISM="Chrysochromulina ericina, Strain CCMP281" /NCGR_SAMPLE_ID=MMETSP1096 /ASSEMBLY_ACC=CAM_ASM_000453 /LENGTH=55 /DNA_ID=CAMNT_0023297175 /DNA_START=448 /DNA_END=615 /DNA_ORIENTATION=-
MQGSAASGSGQRLCRAARATQTMDVATIWVVAFAVASSTGTCCHACELSRKMCPE